MMHTLFTVLSALALVAPALAAPVAHASSRSILAEVYPSPEYPTTSHDGHQDKIPAAFDASALVSQHAFALNAAAAPAPAYLTATLSVEVPAPAAVPARERRLRALLGRAYQRVTGHPLALSTYTKAAVRRALRALRTRGEVRVRVAELVPADDDDAAAALSAEDFEVRVRTDELGADELPQAPNLDVRGAAIELFAAGSALPARRTQMFTEPSADGTLELRVLATDASGEQVLMGAYALSGITSQAAAGAVPRVSVGFALGEDGELHVDARDADSGAEITVVRV